MPPRRTTRPLSVRHLVEQISTVGSDSSSSPQRCPSSTWSPAVSTRAATHHKRRAVGVMVEEAAARRQHGRRSRVRPDPPTPRPPRPPRLGRSRPSRSGHGPEALDGVHEPHAYSCHGAVLVRAPTRRHASGRCLAPLVSGTRSGSRVAEPPRAGPFPRPRGTRGPGGPPNR